MPRYLTLVGIHEYNLHYILLYYIIYLCNCYVNY